MQPIFASARRGTSGWRRPRRDATKVRQSGGGAVQASSESASGRTPRSDGIAKAKRGAATIVIIGDDDQRHSGAAAADGRLWFESTAGTRAQDYRKTDTVRGGPGSRGGSTVVAGAALTTTTTTVLAMRNGRQPSILLLRPLVVRCALLRRRCVYCAKPMRAVRQQRCQKQGLFRNDFMPRSRSVLGLQKRINFGQTCPLELHNY